MVGERAILYNVRNTCRPHILGSVNKGRNKIVSSGIVIKTLFDTRVAMKTLLCSAALPRSEQIREYLPRPGWKLGNTALTAIKITTDASWRICNSVFQYHHLDPNFRSIPLYGKLKKKNEKKA